MNRTNSSDSFSTESDFFYLERSPEEDSPARNNTPAVLNFTQLLGALAWKTITISSIASPEPQIVAIESDSSEPTIHYRIGNQHPIVPLRLNGVKLPPKPFKA